MKILITGCTSPQTSKKVAEVVPTFASSMAGLLSKSAKVDFLAPEFVSEEDLKSYNAVLVGIAPPTSITANNVYNAFSLANRARKLGKLSLFIDAPEPQKIQASLNSFSSGKSSLDKDFYIRRKGYKRLMDDSAFREEFFDFVEFLCKDEWPVTLFPALPWSNAATVGKHLSGVGDNKLHGVIIDSYLMRYGSDISLVQEKDFSWVADSPKTKWVKSVSTSLAAEVRPIRIRLDSSKDVEERLRRSLGSLVSTYRSNEPWWSPQIAMSLSVGVPVATEWRYSSQVGGSWNRLPADIESLSKGSRLNLALTQMSEYLASIPDMKDSAKELKNIIQG